VIVTLTTFFSKAIIWVAKGWWGSFTYAPFVEKNKVLGCKGLDNRSTRWEGMIINFAALGLRIFAHARPSDPVDA